MSDRILFVCLGNICRSPTAEGVFRQRAAAAGLSLSLIDSAGTASWHVGKAPDARTVKAAAGRGYDLSTLRARQVSVADFNAFDFILAMDEQNLAELQSIQPAQSLAELGLFLDYAEGAVEREVPDPYYGGDQGFQTVLDLIENASDGLIRRLRGTGS
ncbi:MAG: low molecular weight protein-tyrosine-phosphatase [Alcanivoracaceae bacterium]|jgi:protein-tyrosine phosphatase|nr:low molecular weight protein-tyrosine-phosphatase [Alcanivoracaceae bacterium]